MATSTFPLRLLAPADRGVSGGQIKFDLFFFFRQSITPDHHCSPRPLSPFLPSLRESFSLSPEPRVAKQHAKPGRENGGVLLAAELWEAGVPAACFAALAPNLPVKFGPEPPTPTPLLPQSEGPNRREKNVLIFLLGEVVLARNGLLSGGERGVRLALFICRIHRK